MQTNHVTTIFLITAYHKTQLKITCYVFYTQTIYITNI